METSNYDCVSLDPEPKMIRELLKANAPSIINHFPMRKRMFRYSVDGFQNPVREFQSQAFAMLLVPLSGSFHIGLSCSG